MDDGNSWIGLLLLAGAVLLFYIMYGFGAAIQALNTSALEDERDEGNKKAERLLHIQQSPGSYIHAVQVLTSLCGLTLGVFSLAWVVRECRWLFVRVEALPPLAVIVLAYILALILVTFFLVCFGIVIPKRVAGKSPIRFCYRTLPAAEFLIRVTAPFSWLIENVAYVLLKLMGIDARAKDDNVTEQDIMYMVNEGHEQGVLEASEAEMITNIFEFDDKEAADIMTHRKHMVALDGEMTLKETVDFIVKESSNSRFPVYEEDIDNIVGILHMRDVLIFAELPEFLDKPISKIDGLLREVHFIPETKNINALFKEMQSQKIHMEVVVDEYGQTAGLVTMEDILEEIVGNIMDEYDQEEEPDIVSRGPNTFQIRGMTPLEDVEDALDIEFEEEDRENFDTLNGFLISRLGHLPGNDETGEVRYENYLFCILKVENKMIKTVLAKPYTPRGERQAEGR